MSQNENSNKTYSRKKPAGGRRRSGFGFGKLLGSLFAAALLIALVIFILSPSFHTGDAARSIGQFGTDVGEIISGWISNIFGNSPVEITDDGDINLTVE